MNTHRFKHLAGLGLGLVILSWGCSHPDEAARSGGIYNRYIPAEKTTVIGTTVAASPPDGYAVIERNRAPFLGGYFLVTRDALHQPTAVLETTSYLGNSSPSQGVLIISGQPQAGDEVVDPGPELAKMVRQKIALYVAAKQNPAAQSATPAPTAATTSPTPVSPAM